MVTTSIQTQLKETHEPDVKQKKLEPEQQR